MAIIYRFLDPCAHGNAEMVTFALRVQKHVDINSATALDFMNSFVKVVETADLYELLAYYYYLDLECKDVDGFSIFKDGVKPLVEDPGTEGSVRYRIYSDLDQVSCCFDYLLSQLLFGYLRHESVLGIETKFKGKSMCYYIWVKQGYGDTVRYKLNEDFPRIRFFLCKLQ